MNIRANHKSSKFIIYSDSKLVLLALQNKDGSSSLITKLLNKMNTLSKNNSIICTWIPNHIGMNENERVDKAEKKHSWQTYIIPTSNTIKTHTLNPKIHIEEKTNITFFVCKTTHRGWYAIKQNSNWIMPHHKLGENHWRCQITQANP